ncbi:MAG: mannose-1-phosphate guanylyltransferase/mannose-6-phosphate isomerase, partial [Hyphomicrobium sp.]
PVARNTAPAIAVAALAALADDAGAILAVLPSDHVVKDGAAFQECLHRAAEVAASGKLVLFGIPATEPHTGYGYIRRGEPLAGSDEEAYTVAEFTEKPLPDKAQAYVDAGGYFWNSGIFVLGARAYLDELEAYQPDVLAAARKAWAGVTRDLGFLRLDGAAFSASPNISIDYAVMERTNRAAILPFDAGWNDVGSWSSLWDVAEHDEHGNSVEGDAILIDTAGTYVHSEKALVSTIGVSDLVIVSTPDALLVADKRRSQDVARIVQSLRQSNRREQEQHLRNHRPWGFFETLNVGPRFQVKLLHVKPGGRLSTQMHHHRSEHWTVVRGTAKVTINGEARLVQENESVYITATHWHSLENPGRVPLELIEVQIGSYLGEDDIIRSDDAYHRAPDETK